MFLIRLLMRLCFSWQYVLYCRYDGSTEVLRAVYTHNIVKADWSTKIPHTKCLYKLYPGGMITEQGNTVGAWLPLTAPMHAVYNGAK